MARQVVLLGGTFDPIHHGHLIVARAVAERLGADRVAFVPAGAPPHKAGRGRKAPHPRGCPPPVASPRHRLEMVRLAIAGECLFEVSAVELRRPAPSYTFDTLTEFRRRLGDSVELCWVIGSDMLEDLPNWHQAAEVLDLARIVTATRLPYHQNLAATLKEIKKFFGPARAARLEAGLVHTPTIELSSTDIRRRVRESRSIKYLTPDSVIDYIGKAGLYRPPG